MYTAFIPYPVVQCSSLKAPPNASMQCQHPLEMYSYGSVCTIQCEEGFNLIGTNMTKCSPLGDWSHALPVCQGMTSDNKVLKWAWDTIRILHNLFSLLLQLYVSNQTGWYVSCESNWSFCVFFSKVKRCNPINPPHGSVSCYDPYGSFSFGSRCTVTCDEGFLLNGTASAECNSLGMWSADIAPCLGMKMSLVWCETHFLFSI